MTSKYDKRFPAEFKAEAVRMYPDDPPAKTLANQAGGHDQSDQYILS